mgnify:CR=1 FL=1
MWNTILATVLSVFIATGSAQGVATRQLAGHEISLDKRVYNAPWMSNIFKENILLTIAYGRKIVAEGKPVDWDKVNKPFHYSFELEPGKVFSFTNMIDPKYTSVAQPWNQIHYYTSEGYLSDGILIGDGVCHLASLMNWVAKDAGLQVEAPTNHNFAAIPEISKENGVAIYYDPNNLSVSSKQNLYIKNNKNVPVQFVFDFDETNLTFSIEELSS